MKYFVFRKGWRDDDDDDDDLGELDNANDENLDEELSNQCNPSSHEYYYQQDIDSNVRSKALPQARSYQNLDDASRPIAQLVVTDLSENSLSDFLVNLPNDALHNVSAFLTPSELRKLGQTCKSARKASRSVWKRVRMHGYHCAVNVVTAFLRNELSDAKELVALYCRAGVPIYPGMSSHGMTFATIVWRMGCEIVSRMKSGAQETGADVEHDITVEATRKVDQFFTDRYEARLDADYFLPLLRSTYLEEKSLFWIHQPMLSSHRETARRLPHLNEFSSISNTTVSIHKHLFDQHVLGYSSVDDEVDNLRNEISLSVDFFHPSRNHYTMSAATYSLLDNSFHYPTTMGALMEYDDNGESDQDIGRLNGLSEKAYQCLSEVNVDVYSSLVLLDGQEHTSMSPLCDKSPIHIYSERDRLVHEAKDVFRRFQNQLKAIFDTDNEDGFDECLADFWDYFFKTTADISHYDRHTAIPRTSKLQDFLNRPCPKGVGVIQCEIERIRKVDQTVKGRLFPTYDYRLFIRNRCDSINKSDINLMVAKHIGRHRSRRGVNNYMIYKAKQGNTSDLSTDDDENIDIPTECVMGRLQSNFIGNEFQIFSSKQMNEKEKNQTCNVPAYKHEGTSLSKSDLSLCSNKGRSSPDPALSSCNETDSDEEGNMPSFVRRISGSLSESFSRARPPSGSNWASSFSLRKTRKRIAIADPTACMEDQDEAPEQVSDDYSNGCIESEEGAITYTANILGNRPRVMDICIPNVDDNGNIQDWRRVYTGDMKMLNCFKELLGQLNTNNFDGDDDIEQENIENQSMETSNYGLLALQNKQPWWNIDLGAFVLNFGGRVSVASVKNFQLCTRDDQDHIMLQFGRVQGRHSFTMDYQYPLTATQAFAIAISSLQSKMSLS